MRLNGDGIAFELFYPDEQLTVRQPTRRRRAVRRPAQVYTSKKQELEQQRKDRKEKRAAIASRRDRQKARAKKAEKRQREAEKALKQQEENARKQFQESAREAENARKRTEAEKQREDLEAENARKRNEEIAREGQLAAENTLKEHEAENARKEGENAGKEGENAGKEADEDYDSDNNYGNDDDYGDDRDYDNDDRDHDQEARKLEEAGKLKAAKESQRLKAAEEAQKVKEAEEARKLEEEAGKLKAAEKARKLKSKEAVNVDNLDGPDDLHPKEKHASGDQQAAKRKLKKASVHSSSRNSEDEVTDTHDKDHDVLEEYAGDGNPEKHKKAAEEAQKVKEAEEARKLEEEAGKLKAAEKARKLKSKEAVNVDNLDGPDDLHPKEKHASGDQQAAKRKLKKASVHSSSRNSEDEVTDTHDKDHDVLEEYAGDGNPEKHKKAAEEAQKVKEAEEARKLEEEAGKLKAVEKARKLKSKEAVNVDNLDGPDDLHPKEKHASGDQQAAKRKLKKASVHSSSRNSEDEVTDTHDKDHDVLEEYAGDGNPEKHKKAKHDNSEVRRLQQFLFSEFNEAAKVSSAISVLLSELPCEHREVTLMDLSELMRKSLLEMNFHNDDIDTILPLKDLHFLDRLSSSVAVTENLVYLKLDGMERALLSEHREKLLEARRLGELVDLET